MIGRPSSAFALVAVALTISEKFHIGSTPFEDAAMTPTIFLAGAAIVSMHSHRVVDSNYRRLDAQYQTMLATRAANQEIIRSVAERPAESAKLSDWASGVWRRKRPPCPC